MWCVGVALCDGWVWCIFYGFKYGISEVIRKVYMYMYNLLHSNIPPCLIDRGWDESAYMYNALCVNEMYKSA